jgi:hypothetical protein
METVRVKRPEGGPWLERNLRSYGVFNGRFFVDIDDGYSTPIRVVAELVHPDDLKYLQEQMKKNEKADN